MLTVIERIAAVIVIVFMVMVLMPWGTYIQLPIGKFSVGTYRWKQGGRISAAWGEKSATLMFDSSAKFPSVKIVRFPEGGVRYDFSPFFLYL